MGTVLLCGIQHAPVTRLEQVVSEELLSERSKTFFREQILGRITDETILFVEGRTRTFTRKHPDYKFQLSHIDTSLVEAGVTPTIVGVDDRLVHARKNRTFDIHVKRVQQFMSTRGSLWPFTSYEELLTAVRERAERLSFAGCPTREEEISFRIFQKTQTAFDEALLGALRSYGQYDCVVLAGSAHCLHLHLTRGWPVEYFTKVGGWDKKTLSDLYVAYYLPYLYSPQIWREK